MSAELTYSVSIQVQLCLGKSACGPDPMVSRAQLELMVAKVAGTDDLYLLATVHSSIFQDISAAWPRVA